MRKNTVKFILVLSISIFSQCVKVTILLLQIKFFIVCNSAKQDKLSENA